MNHKQKLGYTVLGAGIMLLVGFAIGCGTPIPSTSTGIRIETPHQLLPPGVPKRVGVIPFHGSRIIRLQATDQFQGGLVPLGFEVVERAQIEAVLNELGFQQTNWVDPNTRKHLGEVLGIEGVFLGSITGESRSNWIDTHLNVRLVKITTGQVVWAAEAHDPRSVTWSMDLRTSAIHTVKEAIRLLQRDLRVKAR